MAGTASVPNVFATQAGQVPASQLDGNWNAVTAYINAREVSSGTLSARPATPTAGLWYFANDDNGGTLYFGNGSTWVPAAVGLSSAVIVPVPISQGGTGSTALAAGVIKSNASLLFSSSTLDVASGGTGSQTWQTNAFLLGNGASPFRAEGSPLNVQFGGTGAAGLTGGSVMVGAGATASVTLVSLAKGSLLVGQGGSTAPVALPVGANSEVLVADSTTASGLRYGNAGASEMVFNDAGGALGAGVTIYLGPWAANPNNPNNPVVNRIMTRPGILSELFVWANGPPGGGQSFTFTVMKNGTATPLAVAVTGSVDRTGNSTSQTVIVQPGDTVTLRAVGSAGAVSGIASTAQLSFYPLR